MEEKKTFKNKKLLLIIPVLLVVAVIGVTYAFFNYTRTGAANAISTGKINFQSSQSANPVNVSNLFPTSAPTVGGISGYNAATADFARVLVTIEGETTYEAGLDYTISAVDVDLTVGDSNDALPLKVHVYEDPTYTHTGTIDNTGNDNDDTFSTGFGTAANLSGTKTASKIALATGHIAGDSTWTGGSRYTRHVIIDAYILSTDIAITDTPGESSAWINGRTQYYTSEWNALANSGASFKILVESTETAVSNQNEEPATADQIPTCPGCNGFMYADEDRKHVTIGETSQLQEGDYYDDYTALLEELNSDADDPSELVQQFIGIKLVDNVVTNAYVCGITKVNNADVPYCLEGVKGNDLRYEVVQNHNIDIVNELFDSCSDDSGYSCDSVGDGYPSPGIDSTDFDAVVVMSSNDTACSISPTGFTYCYW